MSIPLPVPINTLAFAKRGGILPVVAQDATDGRTLMIASTNREALEHTLASGDAWYWSTSRGALWRKGATSGYTQHVVRIEVDCDADALIYHVVSPGPTCHRGTRSCFDPA